MVSKTADVIAQTKSIKKKNDNLPQVSEYDIKSWCRG